LTEDKRTNGEPLEQLSESTQVELRAVLSTRGTTEIGRWTLNEFLEYGLSRAGISLWEWNLRTRDLEFLSESAVEAGHYPFSSPTTWELIVHEADRNRLLEALRNFENTSFSSFDCYFRLSTEVPCWVHARDLHLLVNADGEPEAVMGLFFDATQSELAKEELFWGHDSGNRDDNNEVQGLRMQSERRRHERDASRISGLMDQCYHEFISLFSFSDQPAFRKNAELNTVEVNEAMEQLLGIPADEIVKGTDEEIWGEKGSARLRKLCSYVLEGETVLANTTRNINGVEMEFLDQFYPDWGPNHQIVGICGIMTPRPVDLIRHEESPRERKQASSQMRAVYMQIQMAAKYDCNVLLMGESGTGKDYLARQIHDLSKRCPDPFENFNCAALQKELSGSELFGHEAGAFTGAKAMRKGIFELADKGTVFLNEIGDMPLDLQPKLLTVLETRSFRRVGGEKTVAIGARIIAATNMDLNKAVESNRFRSDLYHRLSVFSIRVPPLRERLDELPALAESLMLRIAADVSLEEVPKIDTLAMKKLCRYTWPGNIRELRNVLERSVIHSEGPLIGPDHIVFETEAIADSMKQTLEHAVQFEKVIKAKGVTDNLPCGASSKSQARSRKPADNDVRRLYREFILDKGWTRAQLARHLGVDSSTLKKWFKVAGLPSGTAGRPTKLPKV
jgi:DNA-binding NtrC family response regulator/PAS domain-containing protein